MAAAAEQAVVLKTTLAAAICHRHNVVGFPARPQGAPRLAGGAVRGRRLRSGPLAVRLHDVPSAQPAGALVALLHLLPHVPRTAADLPLMDAAVAAEGPPRPGHWSAAPAADRFSRLVPLRHTPLIRRDRFRSTRTHVQMYRQSGRRSGGQEALLGREKRGSGWRSTLGDLTPASTQGSIWPDSTVSGDSEDGSATTVDARRMTPCER